LIQFTSELDKDSLHGSIDLRDSSSSLLAGCTVEMFPGDNTGKTVWIRFSDNFSLEESSKYYVDIRKGLRYVSALGRNGTKKYTKVSKTMTFYFITSSRCPLSPTADAEGGVVQRTKYVVVSDIHIGDSRATDNGYNWFSDNVTEFKSFLDDIAGNAQIKELIIAGDLFDEWEMPVNVRPFTGTVTTSDEFFQSCANAPTMKAVIDKLNLIADGGLIRLVYIPGNHDMLMSETAMKKIFPNAVWAGTPNSAGGISGTGLYSPETGISIEHGHIYDFYNAPDPLTQTGSHLPPGYFVSRMYSTKMISGKHMASAKADFWGNAFFYGSWEVVLYQIFATLKPDIPAIITGIDGYSNPYTYAQARDLYFNADIAGRWNQRQAMNGVYSPEDEVSALLAGAGIWIWGDLQVAAQQQYFLPKRAEIVVFGHTHMALLKGYNKYNNEILSASESVPAEAQLGPATKIYANSGTWANKSQTPKGFSNRTYVVISPAQTTSGLDTVSLYQYDPDVDGQNKGDSVLLDEKNIQLPPISSAKVMPLLR
jgi:UDP-2,3-diacylglucosamine pyrophosphatase LpxH